MQILVRQTRVIDYCEDGYICMGPTVVCPSKGLTFEDCSIVIVDNLPIDIDTRNYLYINGEFIKDYSCNLLVVEFVLPSGVSHTFSQVVRAINSGYEVIGKVGTHYYNLSSYKANDHVKFTRVVSSSSVSNIVYKEDDSFTCSTDNLNSLISYTLKRGKWNSESKTYDLGTEYSHEYYDILLSLDGDEITEEQKDAYIDAEIVGCRGSNNLKALGTVPSIDIPVILKVVKR